MQQKTQLITQTIGLPLKTELITQTTYYTTCMSKISIQSSFFAKGSRAILDHRLLYTVSFSSESCPVFTLLWGACFRVQSDWHNIWLNDAFVLNSFHMLRVKDLLSMHIPECYQFARRSAHTLYISLVCIFSSVAMRTLCENEDALQRVPVCVLAGFLIIL